MFKPISWLFCLCCLVATTSHAKSNDSIVAGGAEGEIRTRLLSAYNELGDDYVPRTEHFNDDGQPRYINRLVQEASPYLLQHAHNPVNWYPWGAEAFAAASEADKPIFLSIGYATCHWCHVMERESFENEEIAEYLNEHFIAIKVDREQRPDVDSTYMTAVQMVTGRGGWPLSSFLNPGSQPFHGGTYYPPALFSELLERVVQVWKSSRPEIDEQAEQISRALTAATGLSEKVRDLGDNDVNAAVAELMSSHDAQRGGFGDAPKFPREPALLFLLDQARRTGDTEVLDAADFTLERIAAGGIHDQVGGGFHRYATDSNWLIPHFEKMLYNQAGLATVFTEGWLLTGNQEHRRTARRALDYVLREMTSADGMFFSATDADSGEGEGEFFVWSLDEIRDSLSAEDAELAIKAWNVTEHGNFENHNILHHIGPLKVVAAELDMDAQVLAEKLDEISVVLLEKRQSRELPLRDEKMITGWNGMMIKALALAGDAFDEPAYIDAARKSADALISENFQVSESGGQLSRAKFNGQWSVKAGQADYAYLAEGLLALFDITGEATYLQQTEKLVEAMNREFWDDAGSGYFMGSQVVAGASLPTRPKDIYDNAFQSGNASAARVLVRLWRRTGNLDYQDKAMALFGAFSESIARGASNFPYLLTALSELQYETGPRQFAANGNVRVHAQVHNEQIEVKIDIAEGWHINAHEPLQDYLIGTALLDAANRPLNGVSYPAAKKAVLGFQRAELALYDQQISINAPLPADAVASIGNTTPVSLKLQACNDKICLAPETLTLSLPISAASL